MGDSNNEWGELAAHDAELAEVWDSYERLPEAGQNPALDSFVESKHITIDSLVRLGAKLSDTTVLAFAFPGGIKYRDIVTGRRWTYHDSHWTGLKIVRAGVEPTSRCILAEGETDGARLTLLYDVDVAVLPGGARYFPMEFAAQLLSYDAVFVGLDNDEAGEIGAALVLERLPNAMRFAPPGNDWCSSADTEAPDLPEEIERPAELQVLVSAGELLTFEMPEIASWFEHDLLPIGGQLILHGWAKSFKSFMAIDLLAALAQGQDWCLFEPTEEPCKVAVVQFEIPPKYYRDRVQTLLDHAREPDLLRENFMTWTPLQRPRLRAGDKATEDHVMLELMAAGIQVVLVDPIRRAMGTLNTNAGEDARKILSFYERLQNEGITVVTTHHDNKTAARSGGGDPIGMTGAGDFAGDADTIVSVSLPRGKKIEDPQRNLSFLLRNSPSIGARGMEMQSDGHIVYSTEMFGDFADDSDADEVAENMPAI